MATFGVLNSTNDTNCTKPELQDWVVAVVPVCILVFTALGIVLNVFVLMVFCLHKKACTMPEIYLSNLAAADLVLLACLPFWAINISRELKWPFGLFMCKVVNLGIIMNIYCSIYFLVLVSIDRYVALVHTLSHSNMRRPKYAKLGCLMVWGFGLLMGVPTLHYRDLETKCNSTSCYLNYGGFYVSLTFQVLLTLFSFIIPISIITFCTVQIVRALKNRPMESLGRHNTEHKATTLVLVVLLAFLICWVPFHLLKIVEILIRAKVISEEINGLKTCYSIFNYLAFFNSFLNPILYVIIGRNFRKKVTELFTQRGRRGTITMSTHTHLMRSLKLEDFPR